MMKIAEMTAQIVRIVQKIAAEGGGHDLVVGLSDGIKALMKRLKKPIKEIM
jgi:NH3-dependent NAD+ synthetase